MRLEPEDTYERGTFPVILGTRCRQVESANIGKAPPKPDFLDEEAEQGDGQLKEEGESKSVGSDEVG